MARRILITVGIVIVAAFLYFEYASYDAGRAAASGDVYSNDPPASKAKADAVSEPGDGKTPAASGGPTIVYPTASPQAAAAPATDQTAQSGAAAPAKGAMPATDSISPNPPNGMVFAGTGKYQLYRQGNITWRLNTETGESCIAFATDEEWKKDKVLRAGCKGK